MPEWAKDEPAHFWQAADEFERANGSTYREFEIALPRELNPEQRLELVRDFVKQEMGDKHAYSFAIHNPQASIDGGEQMTVSSEALNAISNAITLNFLNEAAQRKAAPVSHQHRLNRI